MNQIHRIGYLTDMLDRSGKVFAPDMPDTECKRKAAGEQQRDEQI